MPRSKAQSKAPQPDASFSGSLTHSRLRQAPTESSYRIADGNSIFAAD
jgi:hypothetical protein